MKRIVVPLLAAGALGSAAAQPATGRYEARLCVQLGDAAPSCGPADAQVRRNRRLDVHISDIVYQLTPRGNELEVVLMHGQMQIDGFVASFAWEGSTLAFFDADKRTRYALSLDTAGR